MFELTGKYNSAKVFTDIIEQEAISQIINMCSQKAFEGSQVRIMPDVHAGKGCTIGTTMTIKDKVVPNLVGVDIGCGMEVCILGNDAVDFEKLDNVIRNRVPSGFTIREKRHRFASNVDLKQLRCFEQIKETEERAVRSLGTLGGGNHFIEVDVSDDGVHYLVIHSGSRHLGVAVASFLAFCYSAGRGVEQDDKKALEWYTKAAEQGHAEALFHLGLCYEKGDGVPRDYEKAVEWYSMAAKQDHAEAQYNLGKCYENGNGVPKDQNKAAEWYTKAAEAWTKAAEQGKVSAQFELEKCYECGIGVPKDYEKAVEWYTKAADQNNDANGQYRLGRCYELGTGVPKDYKKAVEWYRKAESQGHADAHKRLAEDNLEVKS